MPTHQVKLHLLAYDIADRKRLAKVHRTLKRVGIPLQYSVFLVPGTQAMLESLLLELSDIIVPSDDDIRLYTLPAHLQVSQLGRQRMSDGILLVGNGPIDQAISMMVDGAKAA